MIRGVFWSAIEKYSGLINSILVSMVLARLLSPKDYGTVAIVSVIIAFLQMFVSLGIGPAIIQRKDLSQENLNSIFTFSLVAGTVVSGLSLPIFMTMRFWCPSANCLPFSSFSVPSIWCQTPLWYAR